MSSRHPPVQLTDPLALLSQIAGIGVDPARGGYSRHIFNAAELELRGWFRSTAQALGLQIEADANSNLWATWVTDDDDGRGVATGSHLDSVPGGGQYDGPLGIASAFAALARLKQEGHTPSKPIHVVAFAEEEGGRFGIGCVGSQLLTGSGERTRLLNATDREGISLSEALRSNGFDPDSVGRDDARLARMEAYVELHIEQGRQLAPLDRPVGLATTILAHGRWRIAITGQGDHAGTAELSSRHDPVLVAAALIQSARRRALAADPDLRARATVGRLAALPGGTNALASHVDVWLDVRAEQDGAVRDLVAAIVRDAEEAALAEGCQVNVMEESFSPRVVFDEQLRARLDGVLGGVPQIPTGAGHDAGILAPHVPAAMIFVRNYDGVSHSPHEAATPQDIGAGADALTAILRDLT